MWWKWAQCRWVADDIVNRQQLESDDASEAVRSPHVVVEPTESLPPL